MGAIIYYDKRPFLASSSTSAQAGYPASNAIRESLARPWRAATAGAEEWVGTFAANVALHTVAVHSVNFASCTVQKSADGVAFTTVGVLTTYPDRHGRRRGKILVNDPSVKAIKIQIAAGTPTDNADGVTYWRIGCVYPWGTQYAVPVGFIFPLSEEVTDPVVSTNLTQDLVTEAATGQPRWSTLQTQWQRKSITSLQTLVEKSANTIWFDCNVSDYPEQQWPVYRRRADRIQEVYDRFQVSRPQLTFRERVL